MPRVLLHIYIKYIMTSYTQKLKGFHENVPAQIAKAFMEINAISWMEFQAIERMIPRKNINRKNSTNGLRSIIPNWGNTLRRGASIGSVNMKMKFTIGLSLRIGSQDKITRAKSAIQTIFSIRSNNAKNKSVLISQ